MALPEKAWQNLAYKPCEFMGMKIKKIVTKSQDSIFKIVSTKEELSLKVGFFVVSVYPSKY